MPRIDRCPCKYFQWAILRQSLCCSPGHLPVNLYCLKRWIVTIILNFLNLNFTMTSTTKKKNKSKKKKFWGLSGIQKLGLCNFCECNAKCFQVDKLNKLHWYDKVRYFACKFSFTSTLISSVLSLPDFLIRTQSLRYVMHIIRSMIPAISKLDSHKACELDEIQVIVLKKFALKLVPVLSKLYNRFFAVSCFLDFWKPSFVVLKNSGEPFDPSNYRPIILLPLFGKVLDALMNSKLVMHLTS